MPIVNTAGVGDFCLDSLSAPSSFEGKAGIIQVIDKAVDGMLYQVSRLKDRRSPRCGKANGFQCAPVNFVSGSNDTVGGNCKNVTGFSATWTSMMEFENDTDSAPSESDESNTSAGALTVTEARTVIGVVGLLAIGLAL